VFETFTNVNYSSPFCMSVFLSPFILYVCCMYVYFSCAIILQYSNKELLLLPLLILTMSTRIAIPLVYVRKFISK